MDVDVILRSQPLLIFAIGSAFAIVGWIFTLYLGEKMRQGIAECASRASVDTLRDRVDAHGLRITTMEAALAHMPRAEQVQSLAIAIADLRGEVRAVGENIEDLQRSMTGLTRRVDLIEAHLRGDG